MDQSTKSLSIFLTIGVLNRFPKRKLWVRVQNSVGIPELDSAPEPDIAWVVRRDYSKSRPTGADVLLMVEVAETSLQYDRGEKADLYAAARIQDYWIVNLVEHSIEVHRKPSRGKYRSVTVCGSDDRIHPLAFPKLSLAGEIAVPVNAASFANQPTILLIFTCVCN